MMKSKKANGTTAAAAANSLYGRIRVGLWRVGGDRRENLWG